MRRPAIALALLGVLGCDDPSIEIDFEIPERYRDQVAEVSLDLILPPAGEPFDCDQIAFREVDEEDVVAATLARVTVPAGDSADLAAVPREADKLFRVIGTDDAGVPVVAACAAYGVIEGDVVVELVGEPTASAVLPMSQPGEPLPAEIAVGVLDAAFEPIPDVEVRYSVTGPGDVPPAEDSAMTGANGQTTLPLAAPELPGPVAVDVRPRWVQAAPPSLLAFEPLPVWFDAEFPGDEDPDLIGTTEHTFAVGRIGPSGEMGIAALGPSNSPITVGRQVFLAYHDPALSPPFRTASTAPIPAALALGVVADGERDELFTITSAGWIRIEPDGDTVTSNPPLPGRSATEIIPAGGCDGPASSDIALVRFSDGSVDAFGPGGQAAQTPFEPELVDLADARLLASGCVLATDGEVYRSMVVDPDEAGLPPIVLLEMNGLRRSPVPLVASGVAFTREVGGAGPYLLGTEITIEGTEITRYRVLPLGERNVEIEMVTRDPTATVAASSGGGDLDGDGELDVAALLSFGGGDRGTIYRLQEILEVDHLGDRLIGLSPAAQATRPYMWLVDFDGDDVDEIVVGSPLGVVVRRTTP